MNPEILPTAVLRVLLEEQATGLGLVAEFNARLLELREQFAELNILKRLTLEDQASYVGLCDEDERTVMVLAMEIERLERFKCHVAAKYLAEHA